MPCPLGVAEHQWLRPAGCAGGRGGLLREEGLCEAVRFEILSAHKTLSGPGAGGAWATLEGERCWAGAFPDPGATSQCLLMGPGTPGG